MERVICLPWHVDLIMNVCNQQPRTRDIYESQRNPGKKKPDAVNCSKLHRPLLADDLLYNSRQARCAGNRTLSCFLKCQACGRWRHSFHLCLAGIRFVVSYTGHRRYLLPITENSVGFEPPRSKGIHEMPTIPDYFLRPTGRYIS